jgi:hypothetical protein
MSRFVRPETVRLMISGGDWLLVKKQLTAGEQRQVFARLMKPVRPGAAISGTNIEVDPLQASLSTILGYLVDWSLCDDDGKPVVIRGESTEVVIGALDALDMDSFSEIQQAIQAHEMEQADARRERQAHPFGEPVSLPT